MGVTGLWTVVAPTARPTQLATLNRKRLAVDASIWIYQFLKAVRDKEGNALRNSHVVGFFRRICKLLYFGIKPVFVFDGGAPILKRETVRGRARRREGRREDAVRTAGKLLALQVARAAEEEDKKRKAERSRHDDEEEEEVGEGEELVYVDEIGMTQKERQLNRGFKRRDQYHLPDLDISIESMGAPNDPRIMSQAELEEYARQFHTGEEINLYDFSKIDFESPFFLSLPPGDRYNILNAARLRSRLRMGYSKQQLDGMFPDRMAFSRFQIERVKERNELTQRLMHINGMAEDYLHQGGRVAGEKGKEYVLVKNEGVEGGWALGVVSNKGKARENAIDLDEDVKADSEEAEGDDEDFEDVAIEGLNRLPKTWPRKEQEVDFNTDYQDAAETIARKRKAVYEARQQAALSRGPRAVVEPSSADADTLFMPQPANGDTADDEEIEELFEDVDIDQNGEEDDLQKAIAMSLEQPDDESRSDAGGFIASENDRTARQTMRKMNSAVNDPEPPVSDDEEGFDLQAALAESRKSKYLPKTMIKSGMSNVPTTRNTVQPLQQKFSGPLPFESLNLGQSLLGKKKSEMVEEDMSGGFERDLEKERQKMSALPLPSWFNAAPTTSDLRNEDAGVVEEDHYNDHITYGKEEVTRQERILRRVETEEVIDVDAPSPPKAEEDIILVESSDDEMSKVEKFSESPVEAADGDFKASSEKMPDAAKGSKQTSEAQDTAEPLFRSAEIPGDGIDVRMDDITDLTQAEPPLSDEPNVVPGPKEALPTADEEGPEGEELVEWSESDIEDEEEQKAEAEIPTDSIPASDIFRREPTLSHSPDNERPGRDGEAVEGENDFEDVAIPHYMPPPFLHHEPSSLNAEDVAFTSQYLMADEANIGKATEDLPDGEEAGAQDDQEYISDSDEELFRQLAIEAEEHARFASSLNNKTPAQAARDYEDELKRLRNQQKKDRRDADEVTQTMVQECQALLRLFGLPYITAPMEAEAQCAELVRLGLVDGIVTDDSDIFLFGGTRIYKNMFNAAKFVECYLLADLEKEYALDRRKLIRFAHLLGSDYTEGIPGIGPVSALEILTDFDTLEEFKEWCSKVQLGRPQDLEHQLSTPFRRKFRNTVQKRLFLPPSFPDIRVDQAYLQPEVDSDPEPFQWGVPDLDKLRNFLMATIGWSQERTDEILVPVIRTLNQQEREGTQANITHFFSGGVGVGASREGNAPRNRTGKESRRLKNAYTTLKGKAQRVRREADGDGDGDGDGNLHATSKGDVEDGSVETGSNGANDVEVVGESTAKQISRHKKRAAKAKAPTSNDYSDDETEDGDFATKKGRKKRRRRVADG
jgi:DNA excision repair protein ERCC-5